MTTDRQPITLTRYTDVDVPTPEGVRLPLRIAAFSRPQLVEFMAGFARIEQPPSTRAIFRRTGEDALSMPAVRERRLSEMAPAARQAHLDAEMADAEYLLTFAAEQITRFVTVQPGVAIRAIDADGQERQLSTGADLVAAFGGDPEALGTMLRAIAQENTLNLEKKRRWQSQSASMRSSSSSGPTPLHGQRPDATATSAAPSPDSASPDAASAAPALIPSGSTP